MKEKKVRSMQERNKWSQRRKEAMKGNFKGRKASKNSGRKIRTGMVKMMEAKNRITNGKRNQRKSRRKKEKKAEWREEINKRTKKKKK